MNITNRSFLVAVSVALQIAVLSPVIEILPPLLRPALVLALFVLVPGILTALLCYRRVGLANREIIGIGLGFGIVEVVILCRILLLAAASPATFGFIMLGTTILKGMLCGWLRIGWKAPSEEIDRRLLVFPLLLLGIIGFTLAQINLSYPAFPVNAFSLNDKWSYLAVIQQFIVSPADLNLRPDTVIFGSNLRLSWNSWVFFNAVLSDLTRIGPIQLIFQYLRPGLFILTGLSIFAFGLELFRKSWIAVLTVALQYLFLISLGTEGFWVWMRLEEDKYIAFVTLMPIAWVFLSRVLRQRRWQDVLGLSLMSFSAALVHPMGALGLLLSAVPVIIIHWIWHRAEGFSFRWLLLTGLAMSISLGVTVLDRIQIEATPYVQAYFRTEGGFRSLDLASVQSLTPVPLEVHLVLLLLLGWAARKDRAARLLFVITAVNVAILSIPIISVLVSRLTTSVGMDRYSWLIPYGAIFTWLIITIAQRFKTPAVQSRFLIYAPLAVMIVCIVLAGFHQWTTGRNLWLLRNEVPSPTALTQDAADAFSASVSLTDEKRALSPTEWGMIAPILWPGAQLLIYNAPVHAPLQWGKINSLYATSDLPTAWAILDELQPEVVLAPAESALFSRLSTAPVGITAAYSNRAAGVFQVEMPPALQNKHDRLIFSASQYTLSPGGCTDLHWDSIDIASIILDGAPVALRGSQTVCPVEDTRYQLEATRRDGSIFQRRLHVFVSDGYDYQVEFAADQYVVDSGGCIDLQWHVEGIDQVYYQDQGTVGQSSVSECPMQDGVYTLLVILRDGERIVRHITLLTRPPDGTADSG